MNIKKLKQAEKTFFESYPLGFDSPEMVQMSKKHKMDKHIEFTRESFKPSAFTKIEEVTEDMIKLVSRSSMVSVFEKPKFRDTVRGMSADNKRILVEGLYELLHGDEENGFNQLNELLGTYKLNKWTLITVFRCYYYPDTDLLFKPTTVKNVIKNFNLEGLVYKPKPSYEFFVKYRQAVNEMKEEVDASLAPNNAAFSGFLMMTMDETK